MESPETLFPRVIKFLFLPQIVVVSPEVWLYQPTEDSDDFVKWFHNQAWERLAFYVPCKIPLIYVRSDSLTVRLILHELGHWVIHKLFRNQWGLQNWWDNSLLLLAFGGVSSEVRVDDTGRN